jgi:radical SAM superfamily enzyme YgiQ (UPF0313 family)
MENLKMNILLVKPQSGPSFTGVKTIIRSEYWGGLFEPLELELLAGTVPHHDVKILDMRIDGRRGLLKMLSSFNPDVVGVTCWSTGVYIAKQILKDVKSYNRDILTIIGGHHVTLSPKDFNEEFVDVIVIGPGEITFKEVVDTYESKESFQNIDGIAFRQDGRLVFTKPRQIIKNLDELPRARRDLTSKYRNKYHLLRTEKPACLMEISRGCLYKCTFCSLWKAYNGMSSSRSAESVVDEIASLDCKFIFFVDPNAMQDADLSKRITMLLKEQGIQKTYMMESRADTVVENPDLIEKWANVGLKYLLIGLESFRDKDLEDYNKKVSIQINDEAIQILLDNNINVWGQFMVNPDFSKSDFKAMADYVLERDVHYPFFGMLTPNPGSNLYIQNYDSLISYNYELFDFAHCLLPTLLPRDEFYQQFANLYRECYSFKYHLSKWLSKHLHQRKDVKCLPLKIIMGSQFFLRNATHAERGYIDESFMKEGFGVTVGAVTDSASIVSIETGDFKIDAWATLLGRAKHVDVLRSGKKLYAARYDGIFTITNLTFTFNASGNQFQGRGCMYAKEQTLRVFFKIIVPSCAVGVSHGTWQVTDLNGNTVYIGKYSGKDIVKLKNFSTIETIHGTVEFDGKGVGPYANHIISFTGDFETAPSQEKRKNNLYENYLKFHLYGGGIIKKAFE